jgi:hypothetical protein
LSAPDYTEGHREQSLIAQRTREGFTTNEPDSVAAVPVGALTGVSAVATFNSNFTSNQERIADRCVQIRQLQRSPKAASLHHGPANVPARGTADLRVCVWCARTRWDLVGGRYGNNSCDEVTPRMAGRCTLLFR